MLKLRAQQTGAAERRRLAVALAVFALLLQSLAPLEILPPSGQAVHFAHVHHGEHGEREGGGRSGKPRQDAPACPVCQALQAGGHSIAAQAIFAAPVPVVYVALPPPRAAAGRPQPALSRPRARAPPTSV